MSAKKRRLKAIKRAAWVAELRAKWDKTLGRVSQ